MTLFDKIKYWYGYSKLAEITCNLKYMLKCICKKYLVEFAENIILKIAEKILDKHNGSALINNVYIQRMSKDFRRWVYSEGYRIYKQER